MSRWGRRGESIDLHEEVGALFVGLADPDDGVHAEGAATGEFDMPTRLATDHSGSLYVVDEQNVRVQKFSLPDPVEAATWGRIKQQY